ncbi:uncharacterized protein LOC124414953 [Diprion similis]|uniref:uncharacterized protein LOC124414953 n=1 Tax=Diprion similis TaxID=362088 RepID=UPI001EF77AE9|nr:uncharacterized protein LOC124414953 [Diprion similis]
MSQATARGTSSNFTGASGTSVANVYGSTATNVTLMTERMRELGYRVTEQWKCVFDRGLRENKMRKYVATHPLTAATATSEALNPRDAFYGGRTGNTSRYYENGWFPVGHPTVYVEEECKLLTGASGCDITRVEGLIKCRVLPPRNLYHPILPVRMHDKLMFALCRSCCQSLRQGECRHDDEAAREFEGTWVSVELKEAYTVTSSDPTTRQGGHFADYIDTFLKIKQEASGWPAECEDELAQMRYLDEYERVEGIRLFWGKFRQREILVKTEVIKTRQQLLELLTNPKVEVSGLLLVNDDVLYVHWSHAQHSVEPSALANVVIAAYTTAQALLKLYSYLEKVDRRVLYYDTDSVIHTRNHHRPNAYEPPTGNFLSDQTDELEPYGCGRFIRAFVSGGPKFYAFVVKRPNGEVVEISKVKGITLNHTASSKPNFEAIKGMVLQAAAPINLEYRAIRRSELHAVVTRSECRTCKPVLAKRHCCVDSFDTLPYGYRAG